MNGEEVLLYASIFHKDGFADEKKKKTHSRRPSSRCRKRTYAKGIAVIVAKKQEIPAILTKEFAHVNQFNQENPKGTTTNQCAKHWNTMNCLKTETLEHKQIHSHISLYI